MKKTRWSEAERLRAVVNLVPEYVDCLIEERMGARAMAEGLDGRELHGPALRKLEKVEARIDQLLRDKPRKTRKTQKGGLTGPQVRRLFLGFLGDGG